LVPLPSIPCKRAATANSTKLPSLGVSELLLEPAVAKTLIIQTVWLDPVILATIQVKGEYYKHIEYYKQVKYIKHVEYYKHTEYIKQVEYIKQIKYIKQVQYIKYV